MVAMLVPKHSTLLAAAFGCSALVTALLAAPPGDFALELVVTSAPRVADPKLDDGAILVDYHLVPSTVETHATVSVIHDGVVVDELWNGSLPPSGTITWDGRDAADAWCSTGRYFLRFTSPDFATVERPISIVRLGVTEIEALDSAAGSDEFPLVYFMKDGAYEYFATPQIHEYHNGARAGEVSDLDLDDGSPRPVAPVHTATDEPVMDGGRYATTSYNYPLCYVLGAAPRLQLTFGTGGTNAEGQPMSAGYPLAGHDLRAVVGTSTSDAIAPGDSRVFELPPLLRTVGRWDQDLVVRWEGRRPGTDIWFRVPGQQTIPLRFYTTFAAPIWGNGADGSTRYAGPWVEVLDHMAHWGETANPRANDVPSVTQLFVRGFVGQNRGIHTAIEGVIYDCYPMGGDGGATHYFINSLWRMNLSALLNEHDRGVYVNCTDNMGATTTMLSMLGVPNMRPVRLGGMTLRAIWGIGTPEYTTNLWGSGSHGFSYHHIVTDADGDSVSDTCMQLDADGQPGSLPGKPGWNHHRPWAGVDGYNQLSSSNNVSTNVQTLPAIR